MKMSNKAGSQAGRHVEIDSLQEAISEQTFPS